MFGFERRVAFQATLHVQRGCRIEFVVDVSIQQKKRLLSRRP
jgi:hypothetical protein